MYTKSELFLFSPLSTGKTVFEKAIERKQIKNRQKCKQKQRAIGGVQEWETKQLAGKDESDKKQESYHF